MYRYNLYSLLRILLFVIIIIYMLLYGYRVIDNIILYRIGILLGLSYILLIFHLPYEYMTLRRINSLSVDSLLEFRYDGFYNRLYCRIYGDIFWREVSSELYGYLLVNGGSYDSNRICGRLILLLESSLISVLHFRDYISNKIKY